MRRTAYRLHAPDAAGRVHLAIANLWLGVEGDHVVCYDERGERSAMTRRWCRRRWNRRDRRRKRGQRNRGRGRSPKRAQREAEECAALEARLRDLEAELRRLWGGNGTDG